MKLAYVATAATAAALTAIVGSVTPLHADTPRVVNPPAGQVAPAVQAAPKITMPARRAAPPALDAAKKATKYGAAMKAIGLSTSPPQTLEMRLTPIAPRLSGSAEILSAGPGYFFGADLPNEPDGAFHLMTGEGMSFTTIRMKFPTESGKYHILDCRIGPGAGGNPKVVLGRGSTSSPMPFDDGHAIGAFNATGSSTELALMFFAPNGSTASSLGYFYGCDFGKAT